MAPLIAGWLNEPLPKPERASAQGSRFPARHRAPHLALFRRPLLGGSSLAGARQRPGESVDGGASHFAHQSRALADRAIWRRTISAILNLEELSNRLQRILHSLDEMPRYRGHFFNWYDTATRRPLPPQYVSSVDSGNLAASLAALRQGCLLLLKQPILEPGVLDGLRDHALRLRDEIPYDSRTFSTMKLFGSLLRLLECQPEELFYWEALLTESRDLVERIRAALVPRRTRATSSAELRYWEGLLAERMDAALSELYRLAPWLAPAFEPELRVNMRDATFHSFDRRNEQGADARRAAAKPTIAFATGCASGLASPAPLYPMLRDVLEQSAARAARHASHRGIDLANRFQGIADAVAALLRRHGFRLPVRRKSPTAAHRLQRRRRPGRPILLRPAGVRSPHRGFPGHRQRRHPARDLAPAGPQAHRLSRSSDAARLERHHVRVPDAAASSALLCRHAARSRAARRGSNSGCLRRRARRALGHLRSRLRRPRSAGPISIPRVRRAALAPRAAKKPGDW